MPETLNLNYYYGNEADQYSFYRIPKILLTDRRYKGVSLEAKVLYSCCAGFQTRRASTTLKPLHCISGF